MLYLIGAIAVLIVAFIWWRYTSGARGARQRDEIVFRRLDDVASALSRHDQDISVERVHELAASAELRPALYHLLRAHEKLDLFPEEYRDAKSQAAGLLAFWMMHPNELEQAPAKIEPLATIEREVGGRTALFVVCRYQMPERHWAGSTWLLGLAGPFYEGAAPYAPPAMAFSRASDKEGSVSPDELVDWYIGTLLHRVPAK